MSKDIEETAVELGESDEVTATTGPDDFVAGGAVTDELDDTLGNDRNDYFDDDELLLAGDDELLHSGDEIAVLSQLENVVTCEVENLYNESNGKIRSRRALRSDPPMFTIKDSSGGTASFVVTNELSGALEKMFGDIRKGYQGVDPKVKKPFTQASFQEKTDEIKNWVLDNKFKSIFIVGVIVLVVISALL